MKCMRHLQDEAAHGIEDEPKKKKRARKQDRLAEEPASPNHRFISGYQFPKTTRADHFALVLQDAFPAEKMNALRASCHGLSLDVNQAALAAEALHMRG